MNILNTYTEVKEMLPKFFCFVLMVATHRVITGQSRVRVTGTLGKKVTLPFTFNNSVSNARHFALYQNYNKKAEYCPSRDCSNELGFDIYSENASVFGQITNLTQGHSGIYWATLFLEAGTTQMSGIVDLIIREEKNNDTVPSTPKNGKTTQNHPSILRSVMFAVIGVLLVVLLAGALTRFLCYDRARGTKPQPDSSPIPEVASFESHDMAEGALAYSVVNISKIRHADTQLDRTPEVQYANIFGNNKIFI
ncbi:uncharacterized protein LOC144197088 isoform X1 [Stigmatopora nigra]